MIAKILFTAVVIVAVVLFYRARSHKNASANDGPPGVTHPHHMVIGAVVVAILTIIAALYYLVDL